MPSSATITTSDLYTFVAGGIIRSAQVNTNFSLWRGHILPVSTDTATAANSGTYDLGAADHTWRGVYSNYSVLYLNTAGALPPTPGAGYMSLYFKNDDKLYKKNSSGTETEIGGGAVASTINVTTVVSLPYTATSSDGLLLVHLSSGAGSVFLPTSTANTGTVIRIKKIDSGANAITVDAAGSETIDSTITVEIGIFNECLTFVCNGTGWYTI